MGDHYYGNYGLLSPKDNVNEQIQSHAKALAVLKATNPDLNGQRTSPFASTNGAAKRGDINKPRKWLLPKTPELNSKQDQLRLERQLAQRRESYEKEQIWTKKQIERLTRERLKLVEEENRLDDAKKRWNISSPRLDPIRTPTSPNEDQDGLYKDRQMQERIAENLRQMKIDFEKDRSGLSRVTMHSYETTQAVQYYMIRDILIDVVNEAVDTCNDKAKPKKGKDMTMLLLVAAEKEYDLSQKSLSKERAMQLIAEEIYLLETAKMTDETVQEWLNIEYYIKRATQQLIINSAEAIATNNNSGRQPEDPAYDLITATFFHLLKERRRKRTDMWKHTLTVHYMDPETQSIMSGVSSDSDVTKLTMAKLVPVHMWSGKRLTPSLRNYIRRESQYWQPERITVQPTVIRLAKRVTGVLTTAPSPSQRMMAIGTVRGDVLVYDLWYDSVNPVRYMKNEGATSDSVMHISWSLDSGRLITLNASGLICVWSMHPGGPNSKDSRNLEFKDDSNEIVPSQLTLLLVLDPDANDLVFQKGPLARSRAQIGSQIPICTAFHPAHTLVGSQNHVMLGFENGDIYKCNVEHQVSGSPNDFENTANVAFPTVQGADNLIGQDVQVELFRAHKHAVIYIGFVGNYGNMISVDVRGYIFIWKYTRRRISHYGWFEPLQKYCLEMAEKVYVTVSNEAPEIYFSDNYVLEKKKMKRKDRERLTAELEDDRREAELEWDDLRMTQVWAKLENRKQETETCVYRPEVVDEKGSPFHIIVRQKATGMLLKHYSQLHRPIQNFASRLLSCQPSPAGRELVFMFLFPPLPPQPGHVTFAFVRTEGQLEVSDMRIDVLLTDEEYERCYREDMCSFQISSPLDALGSSYIYLSLMGALLIFSANTGTMVFSSRKQDTAVPYQWTPKAPTKLWAGASLALASTRGSNFLFLFAENQSMVNVLQLTDRHTSEQRVAVQKAFKYWNGARPRPPAEQTVRRQAWSLQGDTAAHVALYAQRLVLRLADEAVQKVEGAFSPEDRKTFREKDRGLAHQFFKGRLKGPSAAEQPIDNDPEQAADQGDTDDPGVGVIDHPHTPPQGDDLREDETADHPTV